MRKTKIVEQRNIVKTRPAITPEERENYMIAKAMDLVQERLENGTASSQETTHFLKLGSQKNQLEIERLKNENKLLEAKTKVLEAQQKSDEKFAEAIKYFALYSGATVNDEEFEDENSYL